MIDVEQLRSSCPPQFQHAVGNKLYQRTEDSLVHTGTSSQRLILYGGGYMPADANHQFIQWAGSTQAKIMVITWASREEQEAYESIQATLSLTSPKPAQIFSSPTFAQMRAQTHTRECLEMLREATGIILGGGDQRRIMEVLQLNPAVFGTLYDKFISGTPCAGKSAGTACMSDPMINGDGSAAGLYESDLVLDPGLGLLKGVMIEQHCIERERMSRLYTALLLCPHRIGIGVDENGAVAIENNRFVIGLGSLASLIIVQTSDADFTLLLLRPKEIFDLWTASRIG